MAEAHPVTRVNPQTFTATLRVWWPVIVASAGIITLNVTAIVVRLPIPCPLDSWESIIAADACRASVGLPVYTLGEVDHSTHIYGPLVTYVAALIFKFTGMSFLVTRLMSLSASVALIIGLSFIFLRKLPVPFLVAGIAMMTSVHLRSFGYFIQSRPDMEAFAIACLAIVFLYRGFERKRLAEYVLGVLLICVAYLFKQTAAVFCLVPFLSLPLRKLGFNARELVMCAAPPAAIVMLIFAIQILAPDVDHYMIDAVARFPIEYHRLASITIGFVGWMPIIPLALGVMIFTPNSVPLAESRLRWLIASCIVALPASLLSFAKAAAVANTLIPAWFTLLVLSVVLCANGCAAANAEFSRARWKSYAFAWLFTVAMVAGALGAPRDQLQVFSTAALGDQHYSQVVQYVSKLKGRVVSPDDPTIPIRALRQFGRSSPAEADATLSAQMPDYLVKEVQSADYVITVDYNPPQYRLVEVLPYWGFVPDSFGNTDMGPYRLWRKRR